MDALRHGKGSGRRPGQQHLSTDRRRRPTTHPWADAYLRAHGIADAQLRERIVDEILERAAARSAGEGPDAADDLVMEEALRFLDERLASFVGGQVPGLEPIAGRLAFQLVNGPAECPAALLDPAEAPAALRFRMRTLRLAKVPPIGRRSMASRRKRGLPPAQPAQPPRWLRTAFFALCLALLTCRG
jgi:hypothetical protein